MLICWHKAPLHLEPCLGLINPNNFFVGFNQHPGQKGPSGLISPLQEKLSLVPSERLLLLGGGDVLHIRVHQTLGGGGRRPAQDGVKRRKSSSGAAKGAKKKNMTKPCEKKGRKEKKRKKGKKCSIPVIAGRVPLAGLGSGNRPPFSTLPCPSHHSQRNDDCSGELTFSLLDCWTQTLKISIFCAYIPQDEGPHHDGSDQPGRKITTTRVRQRAAQPAKLDSRQTKGWFGSERKDLTWKIGQTVGWAAPTTVPANKYGTHRITMRNARAALTRRPFWNAPFIEFHALDDTAQPLERLKRSPNGVLQAGWNLLQF